MSVLGQRRFERLPITSGLPKHKQTLFIISRNVGKSCQSAKQSTIDVAPPTPTLIEVSTTRLGQAGRRIFIEFNKMLTERGRIFSRIVFFIFLKVFFKFGKESGS
jgi:hypothetical protein